jgi:hypothetical protein
MATTFSVPNSFASATSAIPLSQLDANFSGTVGLVPQLNQMLSNSPTGGPVFTSIQVTGGSISGTAIIGGSISSGTTWTGATITIANGGTGQTTASAAFNALSPITTTGDLIIGTGTNTASRLGIGTNTYVLTSNGSTATWAAPSGTGYSGVIDSGSSITIDSTTISSYNAKTVEITGSGAVTITLAGSTNTLTSAVRFDLVQLGTGTVQIIAGTGATVNSRVGAAPSIFLSAQYSGCTIYNNSGGSGYSSWVVVGDVAPST